jgi:hypothetical protein
MRRILPPLGLLFSPVLVGFLLTAVPLSYADGSPVGRTNADRLQLAFFYSPTCAHCEEAKARLVQKMGGSRESGGWVCHWEPDWYTKFDRGTYWRFLDENIRSWITDVKLYGAWWADNRFSLPGRIYTQEWEITKTTVRYVVAWVEANRVYTEICWCKGRRWRGRVKRVHSGKVKYTPKEEPGAIFETEVYHHLTREYAQYEF